MLVRCSLLVQQRQATRSSACVKGWRLFSNSWWWKWWPPLLIIYRKTQLKSRTISLSRKRHLHRLLISYDYFHYFPFISINFAHKKRNYFVITCSSWSILFRSISDKFLYNPLLLGFLNNAASISSWNWSHALVTEFLCWGDFFPLSPILPSLVVRWRCWWLPLHDSS